MNPRLRTNWTEIFQDFRAMIDAIPAAHQSGHHCVCQDCGSRLFLIHGKRSDKWFWAHEGVHGCEGSRPIFFTTKAEAASANEVFK